jgi:tryptophan synthase alpha chain
MEEIKKYSDTPKAIGFGISSPEQAKEIKNYCEGVIVGSAIVRIIEEYYQSNQAVNEVGDFVGRLKAALNN